MTIRSPNAVEKSFKEKTTEALEFARIQLLLDHPFVGAIIIRQNLVPVVDWRCSTMSSDGQNIFVNPQFFLTVSHKERVFLLAHCIWHTVYMHAWRRQDRDPHLFDIATDMEINAMLQNEKFQLLSSALLPLPQWTGLNAEQIYDELSKTKQLPERCNADIHLSPSENPGLLYDDSEKVVDADYKVDFGQSPEERIREQVIEAAVQYERMRGPLPDDLELLVNKFKVGSLNWKELLAQFVTRCFGGERHWLPPHRRYIHQGLYLQSRREDFVKAVLAIDTSGSTVGEVLQHFTNELFALMKSFGRYELTVICCDAKIQSVNTVSPFDIFDISKIKFKGGGGTNFIPVFEYIEKNLPEAQLLLFFTDGLGHYPEKIPHYPVLWVMPEGCTKMVKWGERIEITPCKLVK